MEKIVRLTDLGTAPYNETWDLQKAIQKRLIDEKVAVRKAEFTGERSDDVLLFVQHPHVYTLGKSGDQKNLLKSEAELTDQQATFVKIDRGGDITYHGPGQIVGYPILDLDRHFTDIHKYLRYLEEVMIRVCADYGLKAAHVDGATGVWVNDEKICAMGIKCSRWVTMHGFALNVSTQLSYFNNIVPCGISDKKVTSLSQLLNYDVSLAEVKEKIVTHFEQVFDVRITPDKGLPELQDKFRNFGNPEESNS